MDAIEVILEKQENFRESVIPLQPSENIMPREARTALSSDFTHRYSLRLNTEYRGSELDNAYAGTKYSEQLVDATERLAMNAFKMDFADVRPIAGHIAAMQVLGNLLKKGDKFLYVPQEWGGYDGYEAVYLPQMLGLKGETIPMKKWKIDYEKLQLIRDEYKAVVLGASVFFHPYELNIIREKFPDSLLLYDGSHVLGLLSQGKFQYELNKIDVLYGSTHKNFPGPQGGLIVGKKELEQKIKENSIWKYYDNFHLGRVAALGLSLEFLQKNDYSLKCLNNTKALVSALKDQEVPLVNEPEVTESCMFLLDHRKAASLSKSLEEHGILVDRIGRVGLNEVTMRGFVPDDMIAIAIMIEKVIDGEKFNKKELLEPLLNKVTPREA